MNQDMRERVHEEAKRLFESGITQDPLVDSKGAVIPPIPILDLNQELDSWFVAITADGRIAGFMQFNKELVLMRYSTFQRKASSLEGCPETASWLDQASILQTARTVVTDGELIEEPFLSYDKHPTRIAWAVSFRDRQGKFRTVFVAGSFAYERRD
ncbi:MAG: hypothetical protein ACXADD_15545 [Candidatus Thorarchaeota archaeon]